MIMWSQVMAPRLDMTLSDLQDLATRQQQQIDSQQQLLASKVTTHHALRGSQSAALVLEDKCGVTPR